jgi:hypothetical protein
VEDEVWVGMWSSSDVGNVVTKGNIMDGKGRPPTDHAESAPDLLPPRLYTRFVEPLQMNVRYKLLL